MSQDPRFVREAFSSIAPRYQLANHVLSLGVDFAWRRAVARLVEQLAPEQLLDVATGTGDLALAIQRRLPELEITGTDFCAEMLEIARQSGESRRWGKLATVMRRILPAIHRTSSETKGWVMTAWLACGVAAMAGDWPNYRGPDHNGISRETEWNALWGEGGPKVLWKASVGKGSSSVVIAAGRAYTMGNFGATEPEEKDTVFCLDVQTGQEIWTHSYPCPLLPKYYEGGTLSTPTVDGGFVYTLSKMGDFFCLEAATGKVVWEQQLNRKLGFALPTWHFSSSPLVAGDRVVLNMGSAGAAFDKKTGELIWENGKEVCGYSTPVPATIGGVDCVVIGGADSILAVTIADGKLLWRYPFFNKHKATAADAIVAGDEVFASCAYGRGCVKIRIAGGQATQVFDSTVMRNLQSCSVLWQGFLYGFDEDRLKCLDFKDSSERWSEKGLGKGSLSLCADGRMLILSDKSELVSARAKPEAFEVIARAQVLSRSMCRTVPVLANGRIYLRNAKGELACLDVRG